MGCWRRKWLKKAVEKAAITVATGPALPVMEEVLGLKIASFKVEYSSPWQRQECKCEVHAVHLSHDHGVRCFSFRFANLPLKTWEGAS